MKKFRFLSRVISCLLVLSVVAAPMYFAPETKALAYSSFYGSNTALRESYVCSSAEAPQISNVKLPGTGVGRYDMFEVSFQLDATYTNPFDPDDICVDGVFVYPSGKTVTIPAFFIEPMASINPVKTLMTYNPNSYNITGAPEWRLRFAGDEIGKYSFYITAKDSKGQTCTTQSFEFNVFQSGNKGWVDISKNNPSILVNSADGTPYYGSGSNMAWVRSQFTLDPTHLSYNYFIGQATGKTNMTRVWMCHWAWLEWLPAVEKNSSSYSYAGLGYYNQCISAAFDEVIQMCEDNGLRIILCTEDNDEHGNDQDYDGWNYNPYHIKDGGFVSTTSQYFKSNAVRQQYKKRIRYILARWGYSSALFSINMWNDQSSPSDDVVSYLDELHDYAHTITDGWRPLLYGSNFKMDANAVLDYTTQSLANSDFSKPDVTNECYASSDEKFYRDTLRNTIWKELTDGVAATMIWSHDDVDTRGCWDLFRNVLDFTADFPFDTAGKFKSGETKVTSAKSTSGTKISLKKAITIDDYGDVASWGAKATSNFYEIDENASGMLLHGYVKNLYGTNNNVSKWKNPPTFVIDAPNGGELVLRIDEFGAGSNMLNIKINGKTVLNRRFTGGRRQTTAEEKYTRVPLEKGENRITLDNTGHDWINVSSTYFILNVESEADMITAHTHVADTAAIVYLENQTYSEVNQKILENEPCDFTDVSLTLEGLTDGRYAVYPFNPNTGEYGQITEANVAGGKVDLAVPAVTKDYAIKLIKLADGQSPGTGSLFVQLQLSSRNPIEGSVYYPDINTEQTQDPTEPKVDTLVIVLAVVGGVVVLLGGAAVAFVLIRKKKSAKTEE